MVLVVVVMHNCQVKKEAKIAQRRQFPDFKVLAPSPRDNQGCSGGEGDLRSWARFLLIHYNRATFVQGSPSLYLCFSRIKFLAILCLGAVFVDSPSLVVQFLAFVFVEIRDFPSFTVLGQPFGVLGAISMKR